MAMNAGDIRLSIERIVFDGVPLTGRERFVAAFREECLARLAGAWFAPSGSTNGAVPGGRIAIDLPSGATPETVGRALARAVVELVRQ
jgi:hypothetical protein